MRQQSTSNSFTALSSRFGAMLALFLSLALTACGGNSERSNSSGTGHADGIPPELIEYTAINKCNNQPTIAKDDVLKIDIKANESLLTPVAVINNDEFQMTGQHNTWSLEHPLTNVDGLVNEGNISLVLKYRAKFSLCEFIWSIWNNLSTDNLFSLAKTRFLKERKIINIKSVFFTLKI